MPPHRPAWRFLAVVLAAAAVRAGAEQLPVRVYTTADGLPRNIVNRIVPDPRGFLWFCTLEGLARFDGYTFTTYGTAEGLPDADVSDLAITRGGEYWVATRKGLCRFRPDAARRGEPRFTVHVPAQDNQSGIDFSSRITAVAQDASGGLWCSTEDAIYRVKSAAGRVAFERLPLDLPRTYPTIVAFHVDRAGTVWVATKTGLYERQADGRVRRYASGEGLPNQTVSSIAEDGKGRLWAGTGAGLCLLPPGPEGRAPRRIQVIDTRRGLPDLLVRAVLPASNGVVWVATETGVARWTDEGGEPRFSPYRTGSGFPATSPAALAEDAQGNVWVGTNGGGAAKLPREALVSYGEADGLRGLHITSIFESRDGDLCVTRAPNDGWIHRYDGRRFVPIAPRFPASAAFSWGWNQIVLQARDGGWWFTSGTGLWRFPGTAGAAGLQGLRPAARYGTADGLPSDEVFRAFEDSRGDVWLGTLGSAAQGAPTDLARWDRASGRVVRYPGVYGTATAFREDRAGQVWIGFYTGGLARLRNGRFESFGAAEGVPDGMVTDLHVDRAGRLWAATYRGGVARVDDPSAARPAFAVLTTAHGLSSNSIRCITEDLQGRIYLGTGRGVDRLAPAAGGWSRSVRHYTTADGLPPGEPTVAYRDRRGHLWFGTVQGLARLVPGSEPPGGPPPVFITGLQVAGVDRPVSDVGESELALAPLAAGENRLQVSFVGLGFAPGERLRYQYRLEGTDREWSAPIEQRSLNFAGLPPGSRRLLVRAVSADGVASARPAALAFRIVPPLWRRGWFQLIALLAAVSAAYLLHRLRLSRALALERVRTQIASDLHDEIGSGLTRMAILSEVVLREANGHRPGVQGPVTRIAELARELGGSMSDIVWAVNPARDRVADLAQRMRRHASETLESRAIDLRFEAPAADAGRKMDPEARRDVFLIFKEALNNAVRHSRCTRVTVELGLERGSLVLRVADDGQGFDPAAAGAGGGNGLRNMRRRADRAGAALQILSSPAGTTVVVTLPSREAGGRRGLAVLGGHKG